MSALIGITRRYQLSDRDGATFGAATGDDVLAQLCADRRAMREGGDVQGLAYVVASAADARSLGAHETVGGEWYLPAIDACLVVREGAADDATG